MTVERVVQPVVACIGNPVNGNPTQFVMSRVAQDLHLDWRFFTSEVAKADLVAAVAGLKALRFTGVSVAAPFQTQVASLLDDISPIAKLLGQVTVARCQDDHWKGDNHIPQAIINSLEAAIPHFQELNESSLIIVDATAALCECLQRLVNERQAKHKVVQLSAEPATPTIPNDVGSSPSQLQTAAVLASTVHELVQNRAKISALVIEANDSLIRAREMQDLNWANSGVVLIAGGKNDKARQAVIRNARDRNLRIVDEVEYLAYQAALDFLYWTGVHPDVNTIRESLEEYLQW